MLPLRVTNPASAIPSQEDIFSSSLSLLFTDDTQNSHGIPGQAVIYRSPLYGDVRLRIPQHPDVEEGRQLFAHFLWNAGVVVADAIESASCDGSTSVPEEGKVAWTSKYWSVRDKNVLELGAGTALPSLIAALSSAKSVTITDHPSSPALVNDTISQNVLANLHVDLLPSHGPSRPPNQVEYKARTSSDISVHGLTWGDPLFTSSTIYGRPSDPQPAQQSFDTIIVADCLWMPSQHVNLVKTIDSYLRQENNAGTETKEACACALVVAGFHTGREIVARFFEIATGSCTGGIEERRQNLTGAEVDDVRDVIGEEKNEEGDAKQVRGFLRAADMFEIDVDCNIRPWLPIRLGETLAQKKRWCVCAVLVRKSIL